MMTRTNRSTGRQVEIGTPEEFGLDAEDGNWITSCTDHGTLVYSLTKRLAKTTTGLDFCDDCRDEYLAKHDGVW